MDLGSTCCSETHTSLRGRTSGINRLCQCFIVYTTVYKEVNKCIDPINNEGSGEPNTSLGHVCRTNKIIGSFSGSSVDRPSPPPHVRRDRKTSIGLFYGLIIRPIDYGADTPSSETLPCLNTSTRRPSFDETLPWSSGSSLLLR